jgi:hypothetical protein
MSTRNRFVFRATLAITSIVLVAIFIAVTSAVSTANRTMFTGEEHHQVTSDQAARWTAEYQKTMGDGALVAGYFGKNIFEKILSQEEAVGIRIYKAKHDNGDEVLVLVGVDGKGNDIVSGVVGENIIPCPPFCGGFDVFTKGLDQKPMASVR